MKTSQNTNVKAVYANLRKFTSEEYVAMHNRISLRAEIVSNEIKSESAKGRRMSKTSTANYMLHINTIILPFYRESRNVRWKDLQN